MKKYQVLISCLMFVCGIAGFRLAARAAEIIYVEGTAQVQPDQQESWKIAEKGMQLGTGDTIRTARRSRVDVALDAAKRNIVRIDPKTTAVLNSNNGGGIDRIDISRGKVYSNLEDLKAGLAFEVTTPSAVAGVRGSAYSVNVERDEDEVHAFKDDVYLKAFDAAGNLLLETTLPQGFTTMIERFDTPSIFTQVSERAYERFDRITEEIGEHAEGKERTRAEREAAAQARREEQRKEETQKSSIEQVSDQTQSEGSIVEELSDIKDQVNENTADSKIEELREIVHGHEF